MGIMKNLAFIIALLPVFAFAQNPVFINGKFYENNQLYSGIVKSYDAHQKLVSTVEVSKGDMNGEVIFYFPSGQIMEKGLYAYGEKQGTWTRYNENNTITALAQFKNGKKHGEWKMFSETGQLKMIMYDENGKLSSEKNYSSFN
jgi:antitoxin component YwqK of YwqJK toxin-antitoxin module